MYWGLPDSGPGLQPGHVTNNEIHKQTRTRQDFMVAFAPSLNQQMSALWIPIFCVWYTSIQGSNFSITLTSLAPLGQQTGTFLRRLKAVRIRRTKHGGNLTRIAPIDKAGGCRRSALFSWCRRRECSRDFENTSTLGAPHRIYPSYDGT